MTTNIPSDLDDLRRQFEAWRETRTKRSKTPEHLLNAATELLDRYSVSLICRVCRISPRLLRRQTSSAPSSCSRFQAPEFIPLPLAIPQAAFSTQAQADFKLLLERPDGARLTLSLPALDSATISALCANFLRS